MLGQPYYMSIPEVIGVKLTGKLKEGVTATDLVLTITQMLREVKVVEKFVEYFGPGMKSLSVTDRATIANMTPEYGATLGFFPVDEKTWITSILPGAVSGPFWSKPTPRPPACFIPAQPIPNLPRWWNWIFPPWNRPWPVRRGPRTGSPSPV